MEIVRSNPSVFVLQDYPCGAPIDHHTHTPGFAKCLQCLHFHTLGCCCLQVLGPPRYQPGAEACERVSGPGVAAGLVWTQAGGAVQYIEAAVVGYGHVGQPGKLTLTGQAGDVLEESVQIALSWVRAHARPLGIPPADWTPTSTTPSTASKQHATLIAPELGSALFAPGMASAAQGVDSCKRRQSVAPASSGQAHAARMSEAELAETSPLCWDVHVHLPAGGVPKDGPSAGLPLALALLSLLTGRQLRADTAMTGACKQLHATSIGCCVQRGIVIMQRLGLMLH